MADAAKVFVGRHDFSAFGGWDRQPVRTVHRLAVRKSGRMITIEVIGDAFLRQMVRRIVAGLLRVGQGRATAADLAAALASAETAFAGETAPAHGLTLWKVPMGPARRERRHNDEKYENRTRKDDEQDIQPAGK